MAFRIGDVVTWESQAAGTRKVKLGRIVATVAPGEWFSEVKHRLECSYSFVPAHGVGGPRSEKSYAVLVDDGASRAKAVLYWPRVTSLRLARAVAGSSRVAQTQEQR